MTTSLHGTKGATHQVSYLADVAETIRDDAVSTAKGKLAVRERHLDLENLLNRSDFLDYFKYNLALGVAQTLAANDQRVQAIYIQDPDAAVGGDMPMDVTVHLLVKVKASSAALESFIASLDRALTTSLKELSSSVFAQREFVLSVNLVSEEDVRLGRGYAPMLSSVFAPPLKIWER